MQLLSLLRLVLTTFQIITHIRQNARSISTLPPRLQRIARDSYATSLRGVFFFAAVSTLLAYISRLPVRSILVFCSLYLGLTSLLQIPEKDLDSRPRSNSTATALPPTPRPQPQQPSTLAIEDEQANESDDSDDDDSDSTTPTPTPNSEATEYAFPNPNSADLNGSTSTSHPTTPTSPTRIRSSTITRRPTRRLSMFESTDGVLDLESRRIGGSARSFETGSWSGPRSVSGSS